jgi:hypothetical protein
MRKQTIKQAAEFFRPKHYLPRTAYWTARGDRQRAMSGKTRSITRSPSSPVFVEELDA